MVSVGSRTLASAVEKAASTISKLIKKPWEITGPAASPEFRHSLVKALEYRPVAPTNAPTPSVPHADPEQIYDIKYFERGAMGDKAEVRREVETLDIKQLAAEINSLELPPAPGKYFVYGETVPMTDNPGGGYQK